MDRRTNPSHGYRAVHVIARVLDRPVEIQVRTRRQDVWAQLFEKVADVWGRQIRYGGAPDDPEAPGPTGIGRDATVKQLLEFSEMIATLEDLRSDIERRASPRTSAMKGRKNVPKREFAKLDALVRELEGLKSQANALDAELMNRMETLLSLFHGAK